MTENNRFTIEIIEDKDVFIQQKGANHYLGVNGYVNGVMVVELLNDLSEENDELRQELNCEKPLFTKKRLHQENQQLKSTINTLTHDNTKMKKVLNTTKKENEQIKQVIKEAYNNERTQLGKSVLKQLKEAIQ